MMENHIIYTSTPDNIRAVLAFIGPQPPCPVCGGYGEYEGEFGPVACLPCVSRLVYFIDSTGKRVGADWGDKIVKDDDGNLTLVPGEE